MDPSRSERRNPARRTSVAALPNIDIEAMLRARELVPGEAREGRIQWKQPNLPPISVHYRGDLDDGQQALFGVTNPLTRDVELVELTVTRPHLGGVRWWFVCPRLKQRVRKLYLALDGSGWASREALGLRYPRQEDQGEGCFEALAHLQRRLGGEQYPGAPLPSRPRGMWRGTYSRLAAQHRRLDAQCRRAMATVKRTSTRA